MNYYDLSEVKNLTCFSEPHWIPVKLLTYNLFLRPPGIKTNFSDYKDERLEDFLAVMQEYDIICLQEVFGTFSSRKERLIKYAIKKGFYYIESSPDPSFFSHFIIDGGLVLLSRYPIIQSEFIFFTYSDVPDAFTYRGLIYAKIDIFGETLHIFTGHTQATYLYSLKQIKQNIVTRIEQICETSNFIDDCLKKHDFQESHVALFLADFNVDAVGEKHPSDYVKSFTRPEILVFDGDYFNEYESLISILSKNQKYLIIDLLRENYDGKSPPTYGVSIEDENGERIPAETILTADVDLNTNHCLDYFLQIQPNKIIDKPIVENSEKRIFVDKKSVKVEKFLISGRKFTQLSDHYGVSGALKVLTKKPEDVISLEISK